jgi:hypothetical protein
MSQVILLYEVWAAPVETSAAQCDPSDTLAVLTRNSAVELGIKIRKARIISSPAPWHAASAGMTMPGRSETLAGNCPCFPQYTLQQHRPRAAVSLGKLTIAKASDPELISDISFDLFRINPEGATDAATA